MSIPPLVCSTPPPPDQCEEDKEPDDFDIHYNNSSQDEDDNDGYNYGDFSYTFQSNPGIKKENIYHNKVEILTSHINEPETIAIGQAYIDDHHSRSDITTQSKINCNVDTDIEDLQLDISDEILDTSNKVENELASSLSVESSLCEINITNNVSEDHLRTLSPSPATDDNSAESLSIEKQSANEDLIEPTGFEQEIPSVSPTVSEVIVQDLSSKTFNEIEKSYNLEDDFGDFDNFQFAISDNQSLPVIDTCDNPWKNVETKTNDFGSFTANFQTAEATFSQPETEITPMTEAQSLDQDDDHDDFGDFDDFKSSAVDNNVKETGISSQGSGINFYLSDNEGQVMESIASVLGSIFEEELTEPQSDIEVKLESTLCETWRHLKETDVRQPYIVNWNNSLGQKTLLKALCIDSRNILFGPKWSHNMPKYAVNLSNAPLQPQKPQAPSNLSPSETCSTEKSTTIPGGWVDPFTAEGQQSCNTESESVVEVTSSDLDILEAAVTSKSDKIYSSTLNVQPMRQINLPDTHIFTPTNSETPRSKTIHYDSGPPIILPQPMLEGTKPVESFHTENIRTPNEDDDDWEFQDFRGSSSVPSAALKEPHMEQNPEKISSPNVTYQTQVLQPIKMEPLMPSLNWPDPGEVKETFEDFTDFISKTSWSNEQFTSFPISQEVKTTVEPENVEAISYNNTGAKISEKEDIPELKVPQTMGSNSLEDEFDTFQSAAPKSSVGDFAFNSLNSTFNNIPNLDKSPSIIKDFDNTFPKSYKSDTISNENTRPSEALTQSLGFSTTELTSNNNPVPLGNIMPANLLQPLPANSQKPQNTTQILQPLSLESYSQINWPNPGIDLQDLSRFNPVETLQSLKTELSTGGSSKGASPVHVQKNTQGSNQVDDDIWGEFVSSKPKQQMPKKAPVFVDDDEWTDFVSNSSVKPQNGLNTISLNVHTSSNMQKSASINKFPSKSNKVPLDIPTLNYITPKSSGHNAYSERHFQNL